MDDADAVGRGEAAGDLANDGRGAARVEAAGALENLAQALALHELLHDEVESAVGADVQHAHDIGMLEPGGGPGLALEALDDLGAAGHRRVEDLQGDSLVEHEVDRFEDRAHAALPELAHDAAAADLLAWFRRASPSWRGLLPRRGRRPRSARLRARLVQLQRGRGRALHGAPFRGQLAAITAGVACWPPFHRNAGRDGRLPTPLAADPHAAGAIQQVVQLVRPESPHRHQHGAEVLLVSLAGEVGLPGPGGGQILRGHEATGLDQVGKKRRVGHVVVDLTPRGPPACRTRAPHRA